MKPTHLLLSSATVLGAAVPTNPQVNVAIERVGNSGIKATLHNPGSFDITLIKTGSILGESPTRKARLTSSGKVSLWLSDSRPAPLINIQALPQNFRALTLLYRRRICLLKLYRRCPLVNSPMSSLTWRTCMI